MDGNRMSDYTPTTEEVELYFKQAVPEPYGVDLDNAFDRWLAEVKAKAVYDWVRLVQGNNNFTLDNARSFIDTIRIADEVDE